MNRPIAPIVVESFGRTMTLALISILIVAIVGIGIGVVGAVWRDRPVDHISSLLTFVGVSVPEFFWGIVLILLFAGYFKLLPSTATPRSPRASAAGRST